MRILFTDPYAWAGGFYEFTFELPQVSNSFVTEVLTKLWSLPTLDGCFPQRDVEPEKQEKCAPAKTDASGHLYGVANLPNGGQSCCGTFCTDYESSNCWITFYIPLGSLANVYPVGSYPFKAEKQSESVWIIEINNWLVKIAQEIYPVAKFEIGIIGFEVDTFRVKQELEKGIPDERWEGLLIPNGSDLLWFPPTIYDSPYTIGPASP